LTRGGKKERRAVRREGRKKLTYSRQEAAAEKKRQYSRGNLLLADIVEAAQLEERATSLSKDFRETEEEEEEDSRMLLSFALNSDFASDVQQPRALMLARLMRRGERRRTGLIASERRARGTEAKHAGQ